MEETLKDRITTLEQESFDLHSRITSTDHRPTKEALITKRSALELKITHLRATLIEQNEKEYHENLTDLISKNRDFIFFSVNQRKITISKNGEVEIEFYPCGHKITFEIANLLNYHKNSPEQYRMTYDQWTMMFRDNSTITGRINCQKCRKDKEKLLAKFRRYNNRPIGRGSWILRRLQ